MTIALYGARTQFFRLISTHFDCFRLRISTPARRSPEMCSEGRIKTSPPQQMRTEILMPYITLGQPHEVASTDRRRTRKRRPLPPLETRDWMTPNETALALGCSVATVHRLRRGVIPGVETLPCIQYGRKFVFRKGSVARWQNHNEQRGRA